MIGCYDFCGHYEWTFDWLDREGGHPLVRAYWDEAINRDSQIHARELILRDGFAGMEKYWGHTLTEESPFALAQAALRGDKPAVRIAGDVQLAAEVQWLVDHVRWDLEEDLSRLIGDAPAHAVGSGARKMAEGLRAFAGSRAAKPGEPTPTPGPRAGGAGTPG